MRSLHTITPHAPNKTLADWIIQLDWGRATNWKWLLTSSPRMLLSNTETVYTQKEMTVTSCPLTQDCDPKQVNMLLPVSELHQVITLWQFL